MLELLVLQPTPFCNLDCDYCYLPGRSRRDRMSFEVLRRVFERVLASPYVEGGFTVVWHAGEPLVLPPEFYGEAFRIIDELNRDRLRINHSMQTNGTLIDAEWCRFFRENAINLGISVDGPAFLHDTRRKTRDGRGTHASVMNGIRCALDNDIDFHVISVLTRQALEYPDEMFEFYRSIGIHRVGFNVEEIEGLNLASTLTGDQSRSRLREFLHRFLDLVDRSTFRMDLREREGLVRFIRGSGGCLEDNQENAPFRIINIDWAGNVSTFSPELLGVRSPEYHDFVIGSVLTESLEAMAAGPTFRRLSTDIAEGVRLCKETCEYFVVCGGGSPSNKYFENGSFRSTDTLHCTLSKKVVVDVLLDRLEESLRMRPG